MRKILFLLLIAVVCISTSAYSQGWVMEVSVDINHGDCAKEKLTDATISFAGTSATVSSEYSFASVVLKGTGTTVNQTLNITANAACLAVYNPAIIVGNFSDRYVTTMNPSDCQSTSFDTYQSGQKVNLSGTTKFYPRMVIGVPIVECGNIKLSALNCTSSVLTWEVSNAVAGPWHVLSGKTTQTITVNADELHRSVFGGSKYDKRFLRVTNVSGTTSEVKEVSVPAPPPPIVSVVGVRPFCPDSTGTIQVTHGSQTPLGLEYVYTVTQFVRKSNGSCLSGYGGSNSLDQAAINQIQSLCGGATTINVGSEVFCSGFIGNYKKTFTSSNLTYTLGKNSIQYADGSPNYLKLYPGVYIVEIERKSGQDAYDCVCRYVVEIPPSTSVLSIPPTGITSKPPRCKGGNDGSVTVAMTLRGKYSTSHDIKYTILKESGGIYTTYKGRENMLANLASGKLTLTPLESGNYQLKVWDYCAGSPATTSFTITDGQPISLSRSITQPKCLTDSNNDGVAESGDGKIKATVTGITNVTYDFQLYTSSGNLLSTKLSSTSSIHEFPDLVNGGYFVTARTSNNCKSDSVLSVVPTSAALTMQPSVDHALCSDSNDGRIFLSKIQKPGGLILFYYELMNSSQSVIKTGTGEKIIVGTMTVSRDLSSGTYSVRVRDLCNIAPNTQTFNNIVITRPAPINVSEVADVMIACVTDQTVSPIPFSLTGGTPPYDININGVNGPAPGFPKLDQSSATFQMSGLSLSKYLITVTDDCGISDTTSFKVGSMARSDISTRIVKPLYDNDGNSVFNENDFNLSCASNSDGRLKLTVTGGVTNGMSPYYVVKLLDGTGKVLADNLSATGTSIVEHVSATAITYSIGSLKNDIPYMVRITDFNRIPGACTRTFSKDSANNDLVLLAPPPLDSKVAFSNFKNVTEYNSALYVPCRGDSSAIFSTNITGGNPPYSISFSNTATNRQSNSVSFSDLLFDNLKAGNYRLNVADRFGCDLQSQEFDLYQSDSKLRIDSVTLHQYPHGANTICPDSPDGKISAFINGGTGSYTYSFSWNDSTVALSKPGRSHTLSGLAADDTSGDQNVYSVQVMDDLNCKVLSDNITLEPPRPVTLSWKIVSNVQTGFEIPCNGEYATIKFRAQGGLSPYTISTTNDDEFEQQFDSVTTIQLRAGYYEFILTDALGCTSGAYYLTLTEPTEKVQLLTEAIRPPKCLWASDGNLALSAHGGIIDSSGYTFRLTRIDQQYQEHLRTGSTVNFDVGAYSYQVQIADAHGCVDADTIVIPDPVDVLTLKVDTVVSPSCHDRADGSISVTVKNAEYVNGTEVYFKIFDNTSRRLTEHVAGAFDYTFENLMGGRSYNVWVEDAKHCIDTALQFVPSVLVPSVPPLAVHILSAVSPSCMGMSDGTIHFKVTGQSPPYWVSKDGITFEPSSETPMFSGLSAGTYAFVFHDTKSQDIAPCYTRWTGVVKHGRAIDVNATPHAASCVGSSDGYIESNPRLQNGLHNEAFDLGRFSLRWEKTDGDRIDIPFNLRAGRYNAHYSYSLDSVVCEGTESVDVIEPERPFLFDSVTTINASCGQAKDGAMHAMFSGGWSDSVSYFSLDGKDFKPLRSADLFLNNLGPGSHSVWIAQSKMTCIDSLSFLIHRDSLVLDYLVTNPSCPYGKDGSVLLKSDLMGLAFTFNGIPAGEGFFSNLSEGQYTISAFRATDTTCFSPPTTIAVTDPPDCGLGPLTLKEIFNTPTTCPESSDGLAIVQASGGVPPYRYYWNDATVHGESYRHLPVGRHMVIVIDTLHNADTVFIKILSKPAMTVSKIISHPACDNSTDGEVTIQVRPDEFDIYWTDGARTFQRGSMACGVYRYNLQHRIRSECTSSDSIVLTAAHQLSVQVNELRAPTCEGDADGFIDVDVTGGSGNHGYLWSNGYTFEDLSDIPEGTYSLAVIDKQFGCRIDESFDVPGAVRLKIDSVIVSPASCGRANGTAEVILPSNNTFVIEWSNGTVGPVARALPPGDITAFITDLKGCSLAESILIPALDDLTVSSMVSGTSCSYTCDGSIDLEVSGGLGPYSIQWSDGKYGSRRAELCAGEFTYEVTDNTGCYYASGESVLSPSPISITAATTSPSCHDSGDGEINVGASGGMRPYVYYHEGIADDSVFSFLLAGEYRIEINDNNGCRHHEIIDLNGPDKILIDSEVTAPTCFQKNDGSIRANVTGGVMPYQCFWNGVEGGPEQMDVAEGAFVFDVIDANGCKSHSTFLVSSPPELEFVNSTFHDPLCAYSSDGYANVGVTGGTAPFKYFLEGEVSSAQITNLAAGKYAVEVHDFQGCAASFDFEIRQPAAIDITGLEDSIRLCYGTPKLVRPDNTWSKVAWIGPGGFRSMSDFVKVALPGTYTVTVWNEHSCTASKDFHVTLTNELLKADFMRVSNPNVLSPVVFVDISEPAPQSVEWLITDESVMISNQSNEFLELIFPWPGDFEVGMRAYLGDCLSEVYREVSVFEQLASDSTNGRISDRPTPLMLSLFPNPAVATVDVSIHSPSVGRLSLDLVKAIDNRNYLSKNFSDQNEYRFSMDVRHLTAGLYFVIVRQGETATTERLIITK